MKRIGSPENGNKRAFFAKCRESPVRAFRKKTTISVRRCGEGGEGGTEKVRSFVTFLCGRPPLAALILILVVTFETFDQSDMEKV